MEFCLKCGDEGIKEALILCIKCKGNAEHYYCLDELPKTFDLNVQWLCHECKPRTCFGRSRINPITKDESTLHHLKSSSTVTKEKMRKGHVHSTRKEVEIVGLKDSNDIEPMGSVSDSDYTASSRSLDCVGDTDDEWDDKAENSKMGKRREDDIAWTHAIKIKEPKIGLVCKYCSRSMTGRGSITRLKEHLAGGYDLKTIKACPNVPLEVKESMKKIVEEKERGKAMLIAKAQSIGKEITDFSERLKVRKDAAWEYAYPVNGKVNSMVCKFCSQTISGGGITRFKRHLSEKCIKVPPEVQIEIEKVLIKKDIVRAKMDARVDKIKREMRDQFAIIAVSDSDLCYCVTELDVLL
ncbi:hypothetical protein QQ045_018638 [Rhodiola kirilowii]